MARSLMVGLALFGMLLAMQQADAGLFRRGGCSGGSCGVNYYSGCANGSCSVATPVAAPVPAVSASDAAATNVAPAPAPATDAPAVVVDTPNVAVEVTAAPSSSTTQVSTRIFRGRFFSRRSR